MTKQASEVMDEAIADSTIDEMMRRDPVTMTNAHYSALIDALRAKRAMFIEKGEAKAAKKEGIDADTDEG